MRDFRETEKSLRPEAEIKVPVGDCTLGRLFNVLGDTVDGGDQLDDAEHWVIHRDPPSFWKNRNRQLRFWKQELRLLTCSPLMQRVVRSVCSVVAGVGKTVLIQELIQEYCYRNTVDILFSPV